MSNSPPNHDSFFRGSMLNIEIATAAFQGLLPNNVCQIAKFDTMKVENVSFIAPEHRSYLVDILYSLEINDEPGYIYLLAEHQSRPDWLMPYRIYKYIGAIFDYDLNKQVGTHKLLPIVIPLVIYNGEKSPYPYSMDICDLFQQPNLARELMFKKPQLKDLTITPDDELLQQRNASLMYMISKHIHDRDILPVLEKLAASGIFEKLNDIGSGQYLSFVLEYIVSKGDASNSEKVMELLFDELPEQRGEIMTIAEALELKGFEKGAHKTNVEIARKLAALGNFDEQAIVDITGLPLEEIRQLLH